MWKYRGKTINDKIIKYIFIFVYFFIEGCANEQLNFKNEEANIMEKQNQVKLSVEIVNRTNKELVLHYEVRNNLPEDIYLLNRLYHTDVKGNRTIDPNLVYITFENKTVYLSKKMIEVPEEIDVECPEIPYLTLLKRGEIYGEMLNIPVPLKKYTPYIMQAKKEKFKMCSEIVFSIGYFISQEDTEIVQFEEEGNKVLEIDYENVVGIQKIIERRVGETGDIAEWH